MRCDLCLIPIKPPFAWGGKIDIVLHICMVRKKITQYYKKESTYAIRTCKNLRKLPFFAPVSGCHAGLTGEDLRERMAGREAAMFGYFFQGHLRMFGY